MERHFLAFEKDKICTHEVRLIAMASRFISTEHELNCLCTAVSSPITIRLVKERLTGTIRALDYLEFQSTW
jgi:hypothetical protein